ncbi:MAG: outer membrane beta-barrel protein [Bacteroidetes bacterium]|nr:outer membrane beta-barrel protein [Bacteroidota bacterium]
MISNYSILVCNPIFYSAFSQDTLTLQETSEFKRLAIGVNISPDYCYRTLKNNNGNSTSDMIIDLREESEGPKLGYTAGLNAGYNFSKKWGVEMGIQYSNKGYEFKNLL